MKKRVRPDVTFADTCPDCNGYGWKLRQGYDASAPFSHFDPCLPCDALGYVEKPNEDAS